MKKLIIAMLGIAIFTVACKKNETSTIEPSIKNTHKTRSSEAKISFNGVDYQIANNMLQFTTFAQYENLFDITDPNSLSEFAFMAEQSNAMQSYNETKAENLKQHFIGSIVNENGLIKIDAYTLLLDFDNKNVFATKNGTIQDLLNAKMGNVSTSVLPFNMNENDVIEELIEHKTRGVFCTQRYAKHRTAATEPIITTVATNGPAMGDIVTVVKYTPSGIYFELQVESRSPQMENYAGGVVPRNITWTYNWYRRCSNVSGSGTNSSSSTQTAFCVTNKYRNVIYGNVRALKNYYLSSTVTSSASVIPNISKTITIQD